MKFIKFTACLILCALLGVLSAQYMPPAWQFLQQHLFPARDLYLSGDQSLQQRFTNEPAQPVSWQALLPEQEKQVLSQYQGNQGGSLVEQITRSITASTDENYRAAMYSTNIVEDLLDKTVAMSGFIVPLDVTEDRRVRSFFLVPYFGACIHYPPPPPNQIIFVRAPEDFPPVDINQAYTLTGILQNGLYEDMIGTSAYQLSLFKMNPFSGEPDDFRQH